MADLLDGSVEPPMVSSVLTFEGTGDRMAVSNRYPGGSEDARMPDPIGPDVSVLLLDGFLRRASLDAARSAVAGGVPVVLDGGSWKPGLEDLLPLVDVAVCSADFHPPGTAGGDEAIDYLRDHGVERIALTRGADPILYRDGAEFGQIPVAPADVVDTLGAGDVLHGAFAYRLATGADFVAALESAAALATRSCESFGTRAWMGGT